MGTVSIFIALFCTIHILTVQSRLSPILNPAGTYLGQCIKQLHDNYRNIDTIALFNYLNLSTMKGILTHTLSNSKITQFLNYKYWRLPNGFVLIVCDNWASFIRSSNIINLTPHNLVVYLGTIGSIDSTRVETIDWKFMLHKIGLILDKKGGIYKLDFVPDGTARFRGVTMLTNCTEMNVSAIKDVYENRHRKDMKGTQVHAQYWSYKIPNSQQNLHYNQTSIPMTEFSIIKECAEYFNFSLVYFFSGENFELKFGGYDMKATSNSLVYTIPYITGFTAVAVPKALRVPSWRGFIFVFDTYLWISVASAILLFLFVCLLITTCDFRFDVLYVFAIVLGQSVEQPRFRFTRTIFLLWVSFSFIIINAYCGLFLSHLINPMYEKDIDSVEDIVRAKLRLVTTSFNAWEDFTYDFKTADDDYRILYNGSKFCYDNCFEDMALYRNMGIYLRETDLSYMQNMVKLKRLPDFHVVKLRSKNIALAGFGNNPLIEMLNGPIRKLLEGGFVDKWLVDAQGKRDDVMVRPPVVFTWDHLLLPFYIYIVGMCIALLTFMLEIFLNII